MCARIYTHTLIHTQPLRGAGSCWCLFWLVPSLSHRLCLSVSVSLARVTFASGCQRLCALSQCSLSRFEAERTRTHRCKLLRGEKKRQKNRVRYIGCVREQGRLQCFECEVKETGKVNTDHGARSHGGYDGIGGKKRGHKQLVSCFHHKQKRKELMLRMS